MLHELHPTGVDTVEDESQACAFSATTRPTLLTDRNANATLQRAMEPLRLFYDEEEQPVELLSSDHSAPVDEHFDLTERYLADHQERLAEIASVQVAIFLCEATGEIDAETTMALSVDNGRFPRTAAAVADTKKWIAGPESDWPDGFWPHFLLRQLIEADGSGAARAA